MFFSQDIYYCIWTCASYNSFKSVKEYVRLFNVILVSNILKFFMNYVNSGCPACKSERLLWNKEKLPLL